MVSVESILENCRAWIEDISIDSSFITFLNLAIRKVEKRVDWVGLTDRRTVSIGSDGLLTQPAQARKITSIVSVAETGGVPLYQFEMRQDQPTTSNKFIAQYSANPYPSITTPLTDTMTATATIGSADIVRASGTAVSEDWVGERLLLGTSPNYYEILAVDEGTDTITLDAPVQVATAIYGVQIRPFGLERYILKSQSETPFEGDVVVHYQKRHPEVTVSTDWIRMPCEMTISLNVLKSSLITDKYSVDAIRLDRELLEAQNDEIGSHPFRRSKSGVKDSLFSIETRRRNSTRTRNVR